MQINKGEEELFLTILMSKNLLKCNKANAGVHRQSFKLTPAQKECQTLNHSCERIMSWNTSYLCCTNQNDRSSDRQRPHTGPTLTRFSRPTCVLSLTALIYRRWNGANRRRKQRCCIFYEEQFHHKLHFRHVAVLKPWDSQKKSQIWTLFHNGRQRWFQQHSFLQSTSTV